GNEGAGGSADMYRNMSQGDWQVIFDEKKLGSSIRRFLEDDLTSYRIFLLHY
ncbi:hypothetical protein Tco_0493214, partial [Tanacetum coccineum]